MASAVASKGAISHRPRLEDLLRRYFGERGQPRVPGHEGVALGSGFIIDPSGYLVTNNHVVGGADRIMVVRQDSSRHQAKVIGRDDKTDIALLKIDAPGELPYVNLGDSDQAKV